MCIGCGDKLLDFVFSIPCSPSHVELPDGYKGNALNTSILMAIREFEGRMHNHGYPSVNDSFRLVLFCRQWATLQSQHPLDQLMKAIDVTGIILQTTKDFLTFFRKKKKGVWHLRIGWKV